MTSLTFLGQAGRKVATFSNAHGAAVFLDYAPGSFKDSLALVSILTLVDVFMQVLRFTLVERDGNIRTRIAYL